MEENKVAQKLKKLIYEASIGRDSVHANLAAQAILQSPDLRVTIREPRYKLKDAPHGYSLICDTQSAISIAEFVDPKRAGEYAEWLNSKEPK